MVENSVSESQEISNNLLKYGTDDQRNFNTNPPKSKDSFLRLNRVVCNMLLLFTTLGVWGLFMQNMGLFVPNDDYTQKVRVVNTVDTEVQGSVNVNGDVRVNNTVGIDIQAINGHYNAFYDNSRHRDTHYRLPVYTYD
tara:strand:+ start:1201 stop:1614 length:414 start_codon:yes stop_codon:yes gene_type:complete